MFKRYSTNYMAMLLLLDGALIQIALWLGMELRFLLPYGIPLQPEWQGRWLYTPTWGLHLAVAGL